LRHGAHRRVDSALIGIGALNSRMILGIDAGESRATFRRYRQGFCRKNCLNSGCDSSELLKIR
jgi:hypothetical protein